MKYIFFLVIVLNLSACFVEYHESRCYPTGYTTEIHRCNAAGECIAQRQQLYRCY